MTERVGADQARPGAAARSSSAATWATSATTPRSVAAIVDEEVAPAHRDRARRGLATSSTRTATSSTSSCSSCSRRRRSTRTSSPRSSTGVVKRPRARRSGCPATARAVSRPAARCSTPGRARPAANGTRRPSHGHVPPAQPGRRPPDGGDAGPTPTPERPRPGRRPPDGRVDPCRRRRRTAGRRPAARRGGRPRDPARDRRGPGPRRPAGHARRGWPGPTRRSSPGCARTPATCSPRRSTSTTTRWSSSATSRSTRTCEHHLRAVPRRRARRLHPGAGRPGHRAVASWPGSSTSTPAARRCRSGSRRRSPTRSSSILEPRGVIVVVECEHLCMSMRGVRKPGARTITSAVRGQLRDARDPRRGDEPHRRPRLITRDSPRFFPG